MASMLWIAGTSSICRICRGFRLTVSTEPLFVLTDIRMMRAAAVNRPEHGQSAASICRIVVVKDGMPRGYGQTQIRAGSFRLGRNQPKVA